MNKALLLSGLTAFVTAHVSAGTVTTDGPDIVISTKPGLSVKTADDKYSFGIGGRIMWDYNRAELNGEADENELSVRRARLAFTGSAGDWSFKSQFNLGEDGSDAGDVEDLYLRYNGWGKAAKLTIGRQREPFGLEQLTSSNDISVLERSAITEAYAPPRTSGVQLSGALGKSLYYGVGVFEGDGEEDRSADKVNVTGRVAFAPLVDKGRLVHLGAAASTRLNIDVVGLEFAAVYDAFHFQSEWQQGDVDSIDEKLDGYYLQAGWIITGESRPYKDGKFKRVKPNGSAGAWEVVFRYEDGDGNFSDIELGNVDAEAYTLGLNWYYNNNVRFGVNYTDGESNNFDNDGEEFRIRAQFVF
ncbi:ATPase [Exilibacterium tricleocarpae]|uniref:ATPase n=1 Tax=Exilibacterium tricleocarpae TaxID=2591008 RepID=A0A545TNA9_9GAMM|nr:porin [Exilibacterium tricleocarpae]TQV78704.1 ATPase [Exilibacterium tricleocarpae]